MEPGMSVSLIIFLVLFASLGLGYWLARQQVSARAARTWLLTTLPSVVGIGVITQLLVRSPREYLEKGSREAIWLVLGVALLIWVTFLVWQRRNVGATILRVTRVRSKVALGFSLVLLVATIVLAVGTLLGKAGVSTSRVAFFFSFALYFTVTGATGTRMTERGIVGGQSFVPWDRIESHWWEGPEGNILAVKIRKRLLFGGTARFPVPPPLKDVVAEVMRKYLGVGTVGASSD